MLSLYIFITNVTGLCARVTIEGGKYNKVFSIGRDTPALFTLRVDGRLRVACLFY